MEKSSRLRCFIYGGATIAGGMGVCYEKDYSAFAIVSGTELGGTFDTDIVLHGYDGPD
jgi:hypothetical protein